MNTKEYEVIDRNGRFVRRTKGDGNGIVQDGEGIRVPLKLMDNADPALVAATALADSVRRVEAFDARGIVRVMRPVMPRRPPRSKRYSTIAMLV
jgi:hypothetical protein